MSKHIKRTVAAGAVLTGCLVAYLAFLQITGNFYEVSSGTVYRAAQMDGQSTARWKREHGIASILNLRGAADGADWYETERALSDRLGIEHINFGMSEQEELTDVEVQALVEVMRTAPKPLLIHCRAGADRNCIRALSGRHRRATRGTCRAAPVDPIWPYRTAMDQQGLVDGSDVGTDRALVGVSRKLSSTCLP